MKSIVCGENMAGGCIRRYSGAATVEAAMALSLFMFFFLVLFSVFDIYRLQSDINSALHRVGSEVCMYGYLSGDEGALGNWGKAGSIFSSVYISGKLQQEVGTDRLNSSRVYVKGTMSALASNIMEDDSGLVDIRVTYMVKPLVSVLGLGKFSMSTHFYGKAWNGCSLSPTGALSEEDEYVYVAENGTVYHRNRSCTHIQLNIIPVSRNAAAIMRNTSGGKYKSCETCGKKAGAQVYITDTGDRYHASLNCSGLRRTIYIVKLSEVAGKRACSRCG